MKRLKLRIIGIEEGANSKLQDPENIFNGIKNENFPNLKKLMPIKIQEAHRSSNRVNQKRKSSHHIHTKYTEQRKNIKICNGKPIRSTPRLLNRDYESQKGLDRCHEDPKRPQMSAQPTIPRKSFNHYR